MEQVTKPPLGVIPKWIHDEHRREDVGSAIIRYVEACLPVDPEWVEEYNSLTEAISKRSRSRQ